MMINQSPAQLRAQGHDQENESTVPDASVPQRNMPEHNMLSRKMLDHDMPEHGVPPHGTPARAGIVTRPASSAASRRPRLAGGRRLTMVLLASCLVAAGCGGSSGGSTTASVPTQNPGSGNPTPSGPPGVTGTAAAVTGSAIQVQNPSIGQVTVNFTSSTTFTQTEQTTAASLNVGDCVLVTGGPEAETAATDGPITARNIMISKPDAGECTGNGAFRGGFGGGARPSGAPNPAGSPRPQRSPNPNRTGRPAGSAVFGTVTSKSDTTLVVRTIARAGSVAGTRTVTTDSSTAYSQTVPASSAALKVGECVTAVGPADNTGAVTATSIGIRQPGPEGCNGGFRRQNDAGGSANG